MSYVRIAQATVFLFLTRRMKRQFSNRAVHFDMFQCVLSRFTRLYVTEMNSLWYHFVALTFQIASKTFSVLGFLFSSIALSLNFLVSIMIWISHHSILTMEIISGGTTQNLSRLKRILTRKALHTTFHPTLLTMHFELIPCLFGLLYIFLLIFTRSSILRTHSAFE